MRSPEEKKALIINSIGYTIIAALVFLTLTIVLGDRFFGMMTLLGLNRLKADPGWMYVDCSLAKNSHLKFCQPKESYVDNEWKDIKRSGKDYMPFNLVPKEWER